MKSEFIAKLLYTFQDKTKLYLVQEYMGGGDLKSHFLKKKKFSEAYTSNFLP